MAKKKDVVNVMGENDTVTLTTSELNSLSLSDKQIELCQLTAKNASLEFKLAMAEAEVLTMKAEVGKIIASTTYKKQLEISVEVERKALDAQKVLAKELGERYGIDWSKATYTPETGEVKMGGNSEN